MKEEKHVCNGIIKLSPFHLIEEVLGKLRVQEYETFRDEGCDLIARKKIH